MSDERSSNPLANILIVDDNPESLRLLVHLLSRQGYKARAAADGPQALRATHLAPPDLILLDVMMPGMSGYEVCQALKADEATRDIPVIFISALNQVLDKVQAFSVGAVDYVNKPFDNQEILARVKTHLTLYQLQTQLRQTNQQLQQEIVQRKKIENRLWRRNQELLTLQGIGEAISSHLDIGHVLDTVVSALQELLDIQGCIISEWYRDRHVVAIMPEQAPTYWLGVKTSNYDYDLNQYPLTLKVLVEQKPAQVNPGQPEADPAEVALLKKWGVQALLMVPMISSGETLGLIELAECRHERTFTESEIALAQLLANQAATAVQNARLYQQAQQEIAERKQAELRLKETNIALQQRISELVILHFIAQTLTTVMDIQEGLDTIVHLISLLFNTCGTNVSIFDPVSKEIKVIAAYELQETASARNAPANEADPGSGEPVMEAPLNLFRGRLLKEKRPLTISQVQTSPALRSMRLLFQARNIQSLLLVPLQVRGEVIGSLTLASDQPGYEFSPAEERLAETIAGQIAGAVKIAQLFEEELQQRQLAESLRQVATVLSSSLERPIVLNIIVEQLQQVLRYTGALIGLIDGEELVISQAVGRSARYLDHRLPLKGTNFLIQVLQQRQVIILANMAEAEPLPNWFGPQEPGSWMGAPLGVGRAVFGLLAIEHDQVGVYRQEDAEILQAFANHAALAIENARLYEQAQTVAIDAERQRLARELHDSVTQSLYSLTLMTNGWAAMAQRGELNVLQMAKQFKQLEEISLQGLKEMRLLLHHLRPPILEEVGLVGALQHRLDAVEHRVNVKTRLLARGAVDELPLALEEQLFAIAQEALTNTLRHAEATEVIVLLKHEDECLTLSITDNGIGFDPAEPSFGMGLKSIRERTEASGGQLEITSALLQGTTVMVKVDLKPKKGV